MKNAGLHPILVRRIINLSVLGADLPAPISTPFRQFAQEALDD